MKWRKKKAEGRQRESLAAAGGVRGLVPAPTTVRPLTKAQETFRGLLAKVESLRESIDGEEEKLDATLNFYAAEIVPRLARHAALQKDLVRALRLTPTRFFSRASRNDLRSGNSFRNSSTRSPKRKTV